MKPAIDSVVLINTNYHNNNNHLELFEQTLKTRYNFVCASDIQHSIKPFCLSYLIILNKPYSIQQLVSYVFMRQRHHNNDLIKGLKYSTKFNYTVLSCS